MASILFKVRLLACINTLTAICKRVFCPTRQANQFRSTVKFLLGGCHGTVRNYAFYVKYLIADVGITIKSLLRFISKVALLARNNVKFLAIVTDCLQILAYGNQVTFFFRRRKSIRG